MLGICESLGVERLHVGNLSYLTDEGVDCPLIVLFFGLLRSKGVGSQQGRASKLLHVLPARLRGMENEVVKVQPPSKAAHTSLGGKPRVVFHVSFSKRMDTLRLRPLSGVYLLRV